MALLNSLVCYDSANKALSMVIICPTCGLKEEIVTKSVPALKTVIVECKKCK